MNIKSVLIRNIDFVLTVHTHNMYRTLTLSNVQSVVREREWYLLHFTGTNLSSHPSKFVEPPTGTREWFLTSSETHPFFNCIQDFSTTIKFEQIITSHSKVSTLLYRCLFYYKHSVDKTG